MMSLCESVGSMATKLFFENICACDWQEKTIAIIAAIARRMEWFRNLFIKDQFLKEKHLTVLPADAYSDCLIMKLPAKIYR